MIEILVLIVIYLIAIAELWQYFCLRSDLKKVIKQRLEHRNYLLKTYKQRFEKAKSERRKCALAKRIHELEKEIQELGGEKL